jgi:type II secretory pathway pseudopilin PulG
MAAQTLQLRSRSRAGGFTLLELVLGMMITGLVMAAIAALLSAVAQGWKQSSETQTQSNHVVQVHARVQKLLRSARQLGACRHGSLDGMNPTAAALFMWKGDTNDDGTVQFSELGLLVHEGTLGTPEAYLAFYDVAYPSGWTGAQKTAADTPALADDEIYGDTNIDTFKALEHVRMTVVASNIPRAVFNMRESASITRPSLDYTLKVKKNEKTEFLYGTVAVRTPTTIPVTQRGNYP